MPEKPPSFNQAVRNCVWSDFKAGLCARYRVIPESIVSFALSYVLLAEFGSDESAYDLTIEKVLAIPLAVAVLMVLHLLWSWATAPRKVYKENLKAIQDRDREIAELKKPKPGDAVIEELKGEILKLSQEIPVQQQARPTTWTFSHRDWVAEIAGFLRASLSSVAARDFEKYVESDSTNWAARKHLEGLATRLDGRMLRSHRIVKFQEAKVEPARNRISELCELVPLAAVDSFVAGAAEYKSDWKKETYRGLSAVVDAGLAKEYSNLLRSDEPNKQAHEFLKSLSQTLTHDQLRRSSD